MEVAWPAVGVTPSQESSGNNYFAFGFAVAMNEARIARAVVARMGGRGECGERPDVTGPQLHTGGAVNAAGPIDPGGLAMAGPKRWGVESWGHPI